MFEDFHLHEIQQTAAQSLRTSHSDGRRNRTEKSLTMRACWKMEIYTKYFRLTTCIRMNAQLTSWQYTHWIE